MFEQEWTAALDSSMSCQLPQEKSTVIRAKVTSGTTVRPCLVSLTTPYCAMVCSDREPLGACLLGYVPFTF